MVLEACRDRGIPVAVTMAGGYARRRRRYGGRALPEHQTRRRPAGNERCHGRKDAPIVSESQKARTCLIVGAGISGLLAADALQREGWDVTVLDKGRGVGGRMATRRVGGGTFDHGAQFFTVRGDRFSDLVEGWLDAGAAAEWSRGFADADGRPNEDGHPRYRGARGMTSIPKYLARGLDVRTGERAVRVDASAGGWEVACESGLRLEASALLLAMPVPQALELATSGDYGLPAGARQQLEAVSYGPCLALMVLLDGPADVPGPGGMQIKGRAPGLDRRQPAQGHLRPPRHHHPRRTRMEPRSLRRRRSGRHSAI